jgi:hypothetical protein
MDFEIPFDREEKETEQAWSACLSYCMLPATMRSIRNAEMLYKGRNETTRTGKADSRWERWSRDHNWKERAAKIDELRLKNFMEQERQAWEKTREDYNKIALKFQEIQIFLLLTYYKKLKKSIDEDSSWTDFTQAARIFESMAKSDSAMWKRYLQSIGIETLLDENALD